MTPTYTGITVLLTVDTDDTLAGGDRVTLFAALTAAMKPESTKIQLALLAIAQATNYNGLSVTVKQGSGRVSVDLNTLLTTEPATFKKLFPNVDGPTLQKTESKIQYYIEDGAVGEGVKPGLGLHRDGTAKKSSNSAFNGVQKLQTTAADQVLLVEEERHTLTVDPIQAGTKGFRAVATGFTALRAEGKKIVLAAAEEKKGAAESDGKCFSLPLFKNRNRRGNVRPSMK